MTQEEKITKLCSYLDAISYNHDIKLSSEDKRKYALQLLPYITKWNSPWEVEFKNGKPVKVRIYWYKDGTGLT